MNSNQMNEEIMIYELKKKRSCIEFRRSVDTFDSLQEGPRQGQKGQFKERGTRVYAFLLPLFSSSSSSSLLIFNLTAELSLSLSLKHRRRESSNNGGQWSTKSFESEGGGHPHDAGCSRSSWYQKLWLPDGALHPQAPLWRSLSLSLDFRLTWLFACNLDHKLWV